jgi:hypothetical protein
MIKGAGIYCQRSPQKSLFYQCIAGLLKEFEQVYDERLERAYGFCRPLISEVIRKYLECGDLTHGFARLPCDHCGRELVLAFYCKGRSFCPSCNMKRALQFFDWLPTEVLEGVAHQQYVFTIRKIILPYFKTKRGLLGNLCLCAWETIKEFFAACLPKGTVPGAVISIQTRGNMGANFHPHLHALVTKGGFDAYGVFHPLPWIYTQKMAIFFRDKLFAMLIQEGKISQAQASRISSWPHSGFNINNEVQIDAGDEK